MAFEFRLPDIGEGVVEGEVVKWKVAEGEVIKMDQPMVDVMTDKATVEIPAPRAGKVARLMVAEGGICKVGEVLIVIDDGSAQPTKGNGHSHTPTPTPSSGPTSSSDRSPGPGPAAGTVSVSPSVSGSGRPRKPSVPRAMVPLTTQSTPAPEMHDTDEATAVILGAVQEFPGVAAAAPLRRRRWVAPFAIAAGVAVGVVFAFVIYPRLTAETSLVPETSSTAGPGGIGTAAGPGAGTGPVAGPGTDTAPVRPIVTPTASDGGAPAPVGEAALDIVTTPRGASLRLDGTERPERTPLRIAGLAPGRHDIVLHLDGHVELARSVELAAGERRTLELAFARKVEPQVRHPPKRGNGWLTVRTQPWSEVYLGKRKLGATPLADIELPAGTYTLTFKNPQARTTKRRVTIKAGETTKVSVDLPR